MGMSMKLEGTRKIIHIDMDAFFASIEQRDHEELRGKPIAVGFDGPRGVVSTASYEARKYGVHSAISIEKAKKLCPSLIIVPCHHDHYRDVSKQVMDIFKKHTHIIEPLSIDEAFLDVTNNTSLARDIAQQIREEIKEVLNLTASAGVSYNKLLAKIASDYNKPDGMFVIHPDRALDFLSKLPIERFWGVGPRTAQKMHCMGIFTGEQLRQCSIWHLKKEFGKMGQIYYDFARGIDNRPVRTTWIRKSVGCEQTFLEDIDLRSTIIIELYHITIELVNRIKANSFKGRTLVLKIKYNDFTQITRSYTQSKTLEKKDDILPLAKKLLKSVNHNKKSIRLLGLSVSGSSSTTEVKPIWVEGKLDFD